MNIIPLVDQGFVIAGVDYRLSTGAHFHAQVHDFKAAIWFLRVKTRSQPLPALNRARVRSRSTL